MEKHCTIFKRLFLKDRMGRGKWNKWIVFLFQFLFVGIMGKPLYIKHFSKMKGRMAYCTDVEAQNDVVCKI